MNTFTYYILCINLYILLFEKEKYFRCFTCVLEIAAYSYQTESILLKGAGPISRP